jgi:hypothetical protein
MTRARAWVFPALFGGLDIRSDMVFISCMVQVPLNMVLVDL